MSGEPIVFVPGLLADARLFREPLEAFSGSHPVQVALPATGPDVAAMAGAILAHAPPRFAAVGHGLGANVVLEMLRQAPARVTRMALLSLVAQGEPPARAAAREAAIVRARAGWIDEVAADMARAAGQAPLATVRAATAATLAEMALALGPELYVVQARALQRRPDQQRLLRTHLLPTLILSGDHDRECPPDRARVAAGLMRGARAVVLPDTGHHAPLDAPAAVVAELFLWLQVPG